jgi:hypothetical protein
MSLGNPYNMMDEYNLGFYRRNAISKIELYRFLKKLLVLQKNQHFYINLVRIHYSVWRILK